MTEKKLFAIHSIKDKCQNNLEKEEQSWRDHSLRLQTILQSYSNQESTVQAQNQTHRSKEQNREPTY